jgi:phage pi2 protein 07
MVSPLSIILGEIFLQYLEAKLYPETICTRHIQYIVRYFDDVFIIYNETETTAQDILMDHNRMHPSMKYNLEIERGGIINYYIDKPVKFVLVFIASLHLPM